MFIVSCGTDLYGRKQNIKLEFPTCPTMTELINAVESQYDVMSRSMRPAGYPDCPYKIQTFQVYDDILLRWVDLYSSAQLTNGCQIFCFQPESIWHSDSQGIIPEAKDSVTWTTPIGSPRRGRMATDAGVAPALSEKLRSVFYDIDFGNKGYILYSDLRAAFAKADIEFTYATVGELFTSADQNRSGHITYDEWVRFAIQYPSIIDALFFRARDMSHGYAGQPQSQMVCMPMQQPMMQPMMPMQQPMMQPMMSVQQPMMQPMMQQSMMQQPMMQQPMMQMGSPMHVQSMHMMQSPMGMHSPQQMQSQMQYYGGPTPRDAAAGEYETAKREADAARIHKEMAEAKEREAWDKLYYSSPSTQRY